MTTKGTTPPMIGDRPHVGLNENCGEHSSEAICYVLHSSCVKGTDTQWTCQCIRKYLQKNLMCVPIPTNILETNYEFSMDSDASSGTTVGQIHIVNVDGIVSQSTPTLKPDTADFSITIADSSSFNLTKNANTIFINPLHLTLIVSSILSDGSTIVDYTEVTVIPDIVSVETAEIILAEGTRQGSFVSDIPGLNKYTSSDGQSYGLAGVYSGFFSLDDHGDIFCSKTISFDQMGQATDTYAFITELQINRKALASDTPTHVAKLSLLIVRDRFSREILEDTVAEKILGRFVGNSSSNPFDFNLTDVSTQKKFYTYFTYNTSSGAIGKSSIPLDFTKQNAREFQFEIRINWKSHLDYVKIPGEIMVNDVNNHSPVCVFDKSIFQVISGSPLGTYIGLVNTTDVDTVGTVTYSIIDDVYSKVFTITPHSGVLIANQAITASKLGDRISFTVHANDSFGTVDCLIVVDILKLSDENANLGLTFTGTLQEELPPPVHVANVSVQNYTNFKFMTTKDDEYFKLNSTTGEVTSIHTLDRENLPDGFRGNTVTFGIQANLDDEDSCTITIMGDLTINVKDINDNSPCFKITESSCSSPVTFEGKITEDVHDQQEVIFENPSNLEFFDPDEIGNLTVELTPDLHYFTYEIINNVIKILTKTGVVLDREKIGHFSMKLYVKDGGSHTATATLMITVVDVNDNPPVFTEQSYTYSIPENTTVGEEVGVVNATDQDTGLNAEISYSIISSYFSVNEKTGKITTKKKLDRESIASYNIQLLARDNGQPSLTTQTTVYIQIIDVNDNDPTFSQHEYRFTIEENNDCNVSLGSVNATDDDIGNNSAIRFTVSDSQDFRINEKGEIFCRHSLDYESNRDPSFVVTATDGGIPSRSSTTHIVIEVRDKNDNPPKFTHNVTIVNVTHMDFMEHSRRLIALLEVTDRDTGDNGRFHFEICKAYNESFTVADSGAVSTTTKQPDASQIPNCAVTATDYGREPMSSTAWIEFYVDSSSDIGASGVTFNSSELVLHVEEVYSESRDIGRLQIQNNKTDNVTFKMISSLDGTFNNNTLTMSGNNGSFCLDPRSGIVRKSGVFDRETKDTYRFLARVNEANAQDLTLVTINVTDVNERPRFVTTLKQLGVKEDVINTAIFTSELAEDDDLGDNGTMIFNLTKQEPMSDNQFNFDVNTTNGTISVVRTLDYETVKQYNITVEVRDMGTPYSLSATRVFEVVVNNVNDNPPTFLNTSNDNGLCSYKIDVNENISLDSVVLDFAIADIDGIEMFQRSILSVIDQDGCPLKPVSHTFPDMSLLSNATLDYESQTSHVCVIKVTNTAPPHLFNNCSVHIVVQDVNDNFPQTHGPYTVNVTNGKINDVILVIKATDADSGENSRLVYSYNEETDSTAFFGINPSKGSITIVKDLFQFTSAEAKLNVKVSDRGNPPNSNITQVVINIISNNTEPWFQGPSKCSGKTNPQPNYSCKIQEVDGQTDPNMNEAVSNELLHVTACDKDDGKFVKCNCSYEFVEGAHDYFDINKSTGMVRQTKPVDREVTPYFLLNISATDHGYPPRQSRINAVLNISVVDLDDNPPRFKKELFLFNVSNLQNCSVEDLFGPVRATDSDYGINATATYTVSDYEHAPFIYNDTSGYFKVSKSLTNLTGQTFIMFLQATGVTTKSFTDKTFVQFKIYYEDPNKSSPTFNQSIYSVTIPFSTTTPYMIGQYMAVDTDEDRYGEIKYHLESNNWETFVVDSKSGKISLQYNVTDAIPYYVKIVNLTLWATDGGNPPKSGSCLITIILTGYKNEECSSGNNKPEATKQNKDSQYETPLYAVIGVAVGLLLLLVVGFLVMFSRNRVVLNKYQMTRQRLSTVQDPYDLKNESYQRLSKQRSSGEYNRTFDHGLETNRMSMKEDYDRLDEYDRVNEPEPDYDTTRI
ncbi:protocadherin Fat 3-like [Mizuhopecten yessoensis]|nr:protocadherin Fat 3-like [Mizuhopecten yessoensis]XP_021374630.1 protocadherin Fat 3-like [Mizuhopecten yessoensis]